MLYKTYPNALDCGISVEEFWRMTPAEIVDRIESYQRKIKQEQILKTEQLFVLAEAIGSRVAFILSDQKDLSALLQPWDVYPQLFSEQENSAQEAEEERELEKYKEARRRYAAEHNRRREEAVK